ncbi:MAG: hypothetical protein PHZ02_09370 [Desulfocapsaceae bacterium]|nr:hypothetical protein [Desulfocapsaceae bacterium]
MESPFSFRPIYNWIVIIMVLGALFIPPLKMLISPEEHWSATEQRLLTVLPTLPVTVKGLDTFFSQVDNYLKDHFGFRDNFIHRYQREMEKRFGQIGVNAPVIKGLDNWYFYTAENILEDFQGRTPLSQAQLEQWLSAQDKKVNWLRQQGIAYILAVGPDKQSIYPEYLLENAMAIKGISRFEQMKAALGQQPPPYFVNLHDVLRQSKGTKNLYFKNDTHWNMLGAYVAFQTIFKRIAEIFPGKTFRTNFTFTDDVPGIHDSTGHQGDLARMILKEKDLNESFPKLQNFIPCGHTLPFNYGISNINKDSDKVSFAKGCDQAELTAVVFRDSFTVALEPFFSENFKKVIYLWKGYDQKNMEEIMASFKPDIVLEITVERYVFDSVAPRYKSDQGK